MCYFMWGVNMKIEYFLNNDVIITNDDILKINNILFGLKDKITALDFYGNDFDYGYLLWILYVVASYNLGGQGRYHYIKKIRHKE